MYVIIFTYPEGTSECIGTFAEVQDAEAFAAVSLAYACLEGTEALVRQMDKDDVLDPVYDATLEWEVKDAARKFREVEAALERVYTLKPEQHALHSL